MSRAGGPPREHGHGLDGHGLDDHGLDDHGQDEQPRTASITLPPEPTSPRSARELLRLLSRSWHVPALDDADLLLTEVVTNVVVHAHTTMSLHVRWGRDRLRVEVTDCSTAMPRLRRATRRSEHGRGLLLLDRLADAWGVTEPGDNRTCKTVWFEVTRQAEDSDRDDPDLYAAFDIDTVEAL